MENLSVFSKEFPPRLVELAEKISVNYTDNEFTKNFINELEKIAKFDERNNRFIIELQTGGKSLADRRRSIEEEISQFFLGLAMFELFNRNFTIKILEDNNNIKISWDKKFKNLDFSSLKLD